MALKIDPTELSAPKPSTPGLSPRSYGAQSRASSWEEIWEAGPYYQRISELLEEARSYAAFVGWQVDSRVPLPRPERGGSAGRESLKQKVIRLCEARPELQIYFLMWDHAYFYVVEREAMQGRVWDQVHPRVHFVFDNRHPFGASHHEKLAIIDGQVAFCGGIDLCDERWDMPDHAFEDPRRSLDWKREHHGPYHDLAVQVTGPVCREIHRHIARRWRTVSTIPFPRLPERATPGAPLHPGHGHLVYVSRTIAGIDAGDRGVPIVREIEFLFQELIQSARRRIILEGQYYWSRKINDCLIAKMRGMQGQDFEIILILADLRSVKSVSRGMAPYQLELLEELQSAARSSQSRLVIGCPFSYPAEDDTRRGRAKPVYVHSKILLIDDRYVSIGSANLAARALRVDTELNLTLSARTPSERMHLRHLAKRVLNHWSGPYVKLREIQAGKLRRDYLATAGSLKRLPWQWFFDPEMPWLYFLKRRFRNLSRTHRGVSVLVVATFWLAGFGATVALAGAFSSEARAALLTSAWPWLYAALLDSSWLAPVPFFLVTGFMALQLGAGVAGAVGVAALWSASLEGYALARAFPTPAARFFRRSAPRKLPKLIGLRSFPYLVNVIFDPRIGLRSKIAYQGVYSVYFPWFVLLMLGVMPGLVYLEAWLLGGIAGASLSPMTSQLAPVFLVLCAMAALLRARPRRT